MPVNEASRKAVEAQRMRDFLRWQEFQEVQHSPERLEAEPVPYRLACEALNIDYRAIQSRAAELIEQHDFAVSGEWKAEYEDNARTILFEILTESGHLSTIEMSGDPEEMNEAILKRWLNGMQPDLPDHELKRRFNEVCEELILQSILERIAAGDLPPDVRLVTESPYVEGMTNEEAVRLGYRWRNRKGMVRSTGFILHDDGTVTRQVEQISFSNSSAHDIILRRHQEGVVTPRNDAADVDVLGAPLLFSLTDMSEGVIGIQRRIDAYMGAHIRFGAEPTETTPSYEHLREVSAEREAHVEHFVGQLAEWERELDRRLAAGDITQPQHSQLYMKEVRTIIQAICTLQPEYTKDALGEKVVGSYERAHRLMLEGDTEAAAAVIEETSHLETEIAACGLFEERENQGQPLQDPALRNQLRQIQEKWEWKIGRCRIDSCPTGGKAVKVGPCQVCVGCQLHFDAGRSPWKVYADAQALAEREAEQTARLAAHSLADHSESVRLRFEEIVGIGSAELIAFDGDQEVARGDEALGLRRQQLEYV